MTMNPRLLRPRARQAGALPPPSGTPASLLLRFDGNFNDSSANALTVTAEGDATISTAIKKYGSGSGLFGSGDYLFATGGSGFDFGTGDFTAELWAYPTEQPNGGGLLANSFDDNGSVGFAIAFSDPNSIGTNSGNSLFWGFYDGAWSGISSASTLTLNDWNHVAVSRSSGTVRLFLNGQQIGSTTAGQLPDMGTLWIGRKWDEYQSEPSFIGHIDDLRIVKGLAVYTGPFIPPTAPLAVNATPVPVQRESSLLLRFDGNFNDSSANALAVTAIGDAVISTATKKYGSGSVELNGLFSNGTTSGVTAADSVAFGFGAGDFTLEGWFYSDNPSANNHTLFSVGTFQNGVLVRLGGGSVNDPVYVNGTAYDYASGHNFPSSQWTHVAVVRSAGTLKVYVAGQEKLSANASDDIGSSRPVFIGTSGHAFESDEYGPSDAWVGYVDDVRIVKGLAVYTANFTPPAGPLAVNATPYVPPPAPPATAPSLWKSETLRPSYHWSM